MRVLFVSNNDVTTAFLFEFVTNHAETDVSAFAICSNPASELVESVREVLIERGYDENSIQVSNWHHQKDFDADFIVYLDEEVDSEAVLESIVDRTVKIKWPMIVQPWNNLDSVGLSRHINELLRTIMSFMNSINLLAHYHVSKPVIERHMQRLSYLL